MKVNNRMPENGRNLSNGLYGVIQAGNSFFFQVEQCLNKCVRCRFGSASVNTVPFHLIADELYNCCLVLLCMYICTLDDL